MCNKCNCDNVNNPTIDGMKELHNVEHNHSHNHHHHGESDVNERHWQTITVHQRILNKNDRLAQRNRNDFQAKGLFVLNVLSSPGSGKTAFIERMLRDCRERIPMGVIVGDLETDNDAKRLQRTGAPAVQITTGSACHLEADMVAQAMMKLNLDALDVLVIENVGNLVCPAVYDLGEDKRVVLLSVTEGEDKPLKYPTMFKTANVVVVNKIDLALAVGFDRDRAIANIQRVVPQVIIFEVSAKTGEGMKDWYAYLQNHIIQQKSDISFHSKERNFYFSSFIKGMDDAEASQANQRSCS